MSKKFLSNLVGKCSLSQAAGGLESDFGRQTTALEMRTLGEVTQGSNSVVV
jgi:hypothetical protein